MNFSDLDKEIIELERNMWEAFLNGDEISFRNLVADEAMMICGGFRETGQEYANIISGVKLDGYELYDFFVKKLKEDTILINYVVEVKCDIPDMAGFFRVSSLWICELGKWKLVFNQDSRLPGHQPSDTVFK